MAQSHALSLCIAFFVLLCPHAVVAQKALEPITIAEYGEFPLYSTLYIAAANNYFAENGLDVTIVPAGGDEKVFAALLRGDAQFGIGDPTFVAIAGEKGQPGMVLFSLLESIPQWGLTKNPKIGAVTDPKQLKGYSVATYPSPSTSYTLQRWLFEKGGSPVTIKQIPFGALIPALENDQVDIILEYEPFASLAERNGAHRIYTLSTFFPDFALTGLTALPQYLSSNRDIAVRLCKAFLQAEAFLEAHRKESAEILSKRFPSYSPEILESALRNAAAVNTFSSNGILRKSSWDNAVKLRKEVGDLKNDAAYDTYVTTSIAREAAYTER